MSNPSGVFILVSMLSTAYVAHYNAPRFYTQLRRPSVRRFTALSATAFGASIAVFAAMMAFGFLTFGGAVSGNVLNSYAVTDPLATFARVAILGSIIFGYPLAFVGFRDGVLDLAGSTNPSQKTKDLSSVALITGFTVAATFLRNLGLVSSLGGAILGSLIIYIFPSLSFIQALKDKQAKGDIDMGTQKGLKAEFIFAHLTAALGLVFGVIGAAVSLGVA